MRGVAPEAFDPEPWTEGLQQRGVTPDRMTEARRRVLDLSGDGLAWTRSGLAHAAGVSASVIDGLRAQGVFETVMMPPRLVSGSIGLRPPGPQASSLGGATGASASSAVERAPNARSAPA